VTPLVSADPWRRNQYVTAAMVFVVFTAFAFVLPFLPLYVRQLGVQGDDAVALWAGILIGVAPLLAGILAPVWGRLADRYGPKRMALRALASYILLLALSAAVTSVGQLLALRIGVGLFGGIGPLGLSMATSLGPREQTGRAVGLIQAAQILSAAVGPLVGGFLADAVGIRPTFLATSALCAVALVLVALYYEESPRATPKDAARRSPFREVLRVPGTAPLLAVLFLVNFIGRSFTPILPLYIQRLGVPPSRLALGTGMLISMYSVAAALSATWLGRVSGRRSPRALLVATLAGGAVTVLPMAAASSFEWLLVLAVLLGLASGGSLTLCYTIGGLMVPEGVRTTAFGFFSGAALFGGAISPSVAGLLAHWDLRGIYYLDTALFAALTLALLPGARSRAGAPVARPVAPEDRVG
jgi:DHA1 family multidrug resistance protein-like MFS transporter